MHKGRWIYLIVGWCFTGLALLGAVLPLLPTTPFLLLAGTCFARSSSAMHERIWNLPVFGRYLRQWEQSHTVPPDAKRRAWFLIAISLTVSMYFANSVPLILALLGGGLALMVSVALLPEKPSDVIPQAPRDGQAEGHAPAQQVAEVDSDPDAAGDQGASADPQTLDHSQEKLPRGSER